MIHESAFRPSPPDPTDPVPAYAVRADSVSAASLRSDYRGLQAIGLTEAEAGNLSAHLAGLAPARAGWKLREIQRLLFLRSIVESGRLEP